MKYRICLYHFLLLLILSGGLLSCKKYLNKKPDNTLTTPGTLMDLQAMLDNSQFMNEKRTTILPEICSDNYFLPEGTFDVSFFDTRGRHAYLWQYDRYENDNDWSKVYIPVYYANLTLEVLEKIERTNINATQWDNIKGSALFYRSFYFLDISWTFSKAYDKTTANTDPGIPLRLGTDFNVPTVRSSVQQCYERIITDTKESVQYLPAISVHPFRPSQTAAFALLARAYLSMREYDSAYRYANLSLQIKNNLIDYKSQPCTTCDIVSNLDSNLYVAHFKRFNSETIFYTENNGLFTALSTTFARIDTVLLSQYASNDLRRKAFFAPVPGTNFKKFKGTYSQILNVCFTGITTAEMFLTRAECYARGINGASPDKGLAMADLDTLLVKRHTVSFVPDTVATAQEALNKIILERRKELIMRGLRWIDLKRLNKEGENIKLQRWMTGQSYYLFPNDDRYALPIPQQIIDITGISQNTGW